MSLQQNSSQPTGLVTTQSTETSKAPATQLESKSTSSTNSNSDDSGKENGDNHQRRLALSDSTNAAAAAVVVHGDADVKGDVVGYPIASPTGAITTPTAAFRPTALASDALAHLSAIEGSDESSFGGGGSTTVTAKTKRFRRTRKKSNSKKSPNSNSTTTTPTARGGGGASYDETPTTELYSDDIFEIELERGDDDGERGGGGANGVDPYLSTDEEEETPVGGPIMAGTTTIGGVDINNDVDVNSDNDGVHHHRHLKNSFKMSQSLPQDISAAAAAASSTGCVSGSSRVGGDAAPAVAAAASTKSLLVNDIRGVVGFGFTSDHKGGAYSLGDTPVGDLHPFSDGDLTPPMGSPLNRPFSPQSDSELLDRPAYLNPKQNRLIGS